MIANQDLLSCVLNVFLKFQVDALNSWTYEIWMVGMVSKRDESVLRTFYLPFFSVPVANCYSAFGFIHSDWGWTGNISPITANDTFLLPRVSFFLIWIALLNPQNTTLQTSHLSPDQSSLEIPGSGPYCELYPHFGTYTGVFVIVRFTVGQISVASFLLWNSWV